MTARLTATLLAFLALAVVATTASAQQDGSPIPQPTDQLPGLVAHEGMTGFDPNSPDDCLAGREACVDEVIGHLDAHFRPLAEPCDHNAIFALTYLRTTQNYKATLFWDPPLFRDRARVNHFDQRFAHYYFRAWNRWRKHGDGPRPWRIAFGAADRREVTGRTNLTAAVAAHIQHDLPLALYDTGLVDDRGVSRKDDHDAANKFLYEGTPAIIAELARRFDPTIDDSNQPGELDDALSFEAIVTWREQAWRDAERLALAATAEAREAVRRDIEERAAAQVAVVKEAGEYQPGSNGAAQRDAYCAEHWDDV